MEYLKLHINKQKNFEKEPREKTHFYKLQDLL